MSGTSISQDSTVVIVGGGLAASRVCEALRGKGFEGTIKMICSEEDLPYDRPPLSKAGLVSKADTTFDVDYTALDIDMITGVRATALDLESKSVRTTDGDHSYDVLVIATGADPVLLPGAPEQLSLRTAADADRMRSRLRAGVRVVLVGAGWINAEIATAAVRVGCEVVCVEAGVAPLVKPLGEVVGRRTSPWWAAVDLRLETGVAAVTATGLHLSDGTELNADVVVTGIGVRPATEWLRGSGLLLDGGSGGVQVDEHLRSSASNVFAVGDVAVRWSPRFGTRLHGEHWDDARTGPAALADTVLSTSQDARAFDPVPYFWSDQFGHKLQFVGCRGADDKMVFREGVNGAWGVAWVGADSRLTAHLTVDSPRHMVQARMAIDLSTVVDVDTIGDLSTPLRNSVLTPS